MELAKFSKAIDIVKETPKLAKVKNVVTTIGGKPLLMARKYSPEALLVGGIVLGIACTVTAVRSTMEANDILEETQRNVDAIRADTSLSSKEQTKELASGYLHGLKRLGKCYGPSIALGTISVTCLLGSHGIMHGRTTALAGAYELLSNGFDEYRARVVEEFGEDTDKRLRYGIQETEYIREEENPETGRKRKVKEKAIVGAEPSIYARYFDECSREWRKTPEYNLTFLRHQQNYANDMLISRGHVFLNEVYDMLGFPRTSAGAIVGWVLDESSTNTDNRIDFGIYDINREETHDFVNGYNRSILLDFNVDGPIYDLI